MMKLKKICFTLAACFTVFQGHALEIDRARSIENNTNQSARISQDKIDKHADASLAMQAEIEKLQDEIKGLEVYRDHLSRMVDNQHEEITSIESQLIEIKTTRQGIVPLMYDMIASLNHLIENDLPLKKQQRLLRIEKLNSMMAQANISDAEKFRRILEASQIEMDYGIKLGVDKGTITLGDGKSIEVEMLHLGRISLIARSLDHSIYWRWDQKDQQWHTIDSDESVSLNKAFDVANNLVAPSLLHLPLSASLVHAE